MSSHIVLQSRVSSSQVVLADRNMLEISNHDSETPPDNGRTSTEEPSLNIPDGGLVAWLQCAGSFSLLLNSFGVINSFGASTLIDCSYLKLNFQARSRHSTRQH